MNLSVYVGEAPKTKTYVQRKLQSAFARISGRIDSLQLRLEDLNGPKGGLDKACRITIKLRGRRALHIEGRGRTIRETVDLTLDRAKRLVVRSLKLRGEPRRELRRTSSQNRAPVS